MSILGRSAPLMGTTVGAVIVAAQFMPGALPGALAPSVVMAAGASVVMARKRRLAGRR
ncbi:hypothetical protein [Frondihabitans sp. PhB188]|uniref:hypothetical protein n=1 Tax=Frondihabitans sp. PhB188 TaxID=2485200 RepID=UPI0013155EA7|nr:hypothetical protein [Frondihabitans sp. PhB188]